MNLKDYIKYLLSQEIFSFSIDEAVRYTQKEASSIKFQIARLTEKKELLNIRKGFYVIIPPRYSKQMLLPIQLYVEKLFQYLNRKYYLAFYTAAKFYGAAHQQIQKEYVMIEQPKLKDIQKKSFEIRFFTVKNWPEKNIIQKKSDAGYFQISSPALTAADLIHYQNKLGGINRIWTVLQELVEEITRQDVEELLTWYPHKSTLQRLGFLLEKMHAGRELIDPLKRHLQQEKFFPVLLNPKTNRRPGKANNFWKVDTNVKLESDL